MSEARPEATAARCERPRRSGWSQRLPVLGAALVVVHVVWGLVRVPGRVVARRVDDVVLYEKVGAAAFLLRANGLGGADAIEWVRSHTAPDCVVLWAGDSARALEFAPALLAPRLVVAIDVCPPANATWLGRPVARAARGVVPGAAAAAGDGDGAIVLVGTGDGIRLEVR